MYFLVIKSKCLLTGYMYSNMTLHVVLHKNLNVSLGILKHNVQKHAKKKSKPNFGKKVNKKNYPDHPTSVLYVPVKSPS